LQKEKLTCASVTVKIRYSDFVSATRTSKITRTSDDKDIYPVVAKLFNGLFSRRVRVRLVGIQLGAIQAGNVTPDLWDILQPEYKNQLPEVIQIIRAKFGFSSILRSRSIVNQNETRNNHH
jgi:DNA polymerase-4